jgi:hypothetical protein
MTPRTQESPVLGVERAVLGLVMAETVRAREKFGEQNEYSDEEWLAVLVEEIGEAADVLNDRRLGKLTPAIAGAALAEEVVQIAAVATRWLASMGRR